MNVTRYLSPTERIWTGLYLFAHEHATGVVSSASRGEDQVATLSSVYVICAKFMGARSYGQGGALAPPGINRL